MIVKLIIYVVAVLVLLFSLIYFIPAICICLIGYIFSRKRFEKVLIETPVKWIGVLLDRMDRFCDFIS